MNVTFEDCFEGSHNIENKHYVYICKQNVYKYKI